MKKNQSNLYPFALKDQLSNGFTGQTPSVYIRKDLGSFALATNSATEFDAQNSPGLYDITFTAAECNCDVLTIKVTLPDGQEPAILDVVEMEGASSGLTAAEVWQYNGTGGRTVTNTIPSVSDIQSGLAKSDALSAVASNVSAVKAKTDLLPAEPAAVGSAMTLTSTTITSIQNGLATNDMLSSLASHGDNYWVTANVSGLATGGGLEALANYGDSHWSTANVSSLATADALSSVATTANAIKAKTDLLPESPAASSDVSAAQTAIINRGNEAWLTATGFATPNNISDAVTTLEEYGDHNWRGSGGGTPGGSRPLYCNTAMLYAHWTQEKIDTWANGSQTAIDNAIEWACNKIDEDLRNAASVPFQPVPASIRDLSILAAGARLAELAGVTGDPSVNAALAYYVSFVEDYNYRANA